MRPWRNSQLAEPQRVEGWSAKAQQFNNAAKAGGTASWLGNYKGLIVEKKIIRLPEVMAKVGLKKSAIYNMIRRGDFPAQVRLGLHASGWIESEIEDWVSSRTETAATQGAVTMANIIRMPMAGEVLPAAELIQITGCASGPDQARWLAEHRWRYHHNEAGELVVGRLYARLKLCGIDPKDLSL